VRLARICRYGRRDRIVRAADGRDAGVGVSIRAGLGLRIAFAAVCALAFASCSHRPPSPKQAQARYEAWRAQGDRAARIDAYRTALQAQGVGDVAPMWAMLRTARSWRDCGGHEYSIPPDALWAQIAPTLRVVERLRQMGAIDPQQVRSGYRDPALNACAGGAKGSKHLQNVALDFDLPDRPDNIETLCGFWREHGQALNMGLGFYTPTAIHIDTAGYRTWGTDHTRKTSLCLSDAEKKD
jgi:hypothetical protein